MAKDLAIVLNNGSLNSAVATAMAAQKYRPLMVFAEVEQGAGSRARAAYDQQVAHFKPYREHTLRLTEALQKEGKVFELMIYPGKAHGISGKPAQLHVYKTITTFFEDKLR